MPASENIRNIAVIGPPGSGRMTFLKSLSASGAAVQQDANDVVVASVLHEDTIINLLGPVQSPNGTALALAASDAAIFVLSAIEDDASIDSNTAEIWQRCAESERSRAIVLTRADSDDADFEDAIMHSMSEFDEVAAIVPLYLPLLADEEGVAGLLDLLTFEIVDYSGPQRVLRQAQDAHIALIAEDRARLLEGIITESDDGTLIESFIAGEPLDASVLAAELTNAIQRGHLCPVVFHATEPIGFGHIEIFELLATSFPAPQTRNLPLVADQSGRLVSIGDEKDEPLVALVLNVHRGTEGAIHAVVRIFAGEITKGMQVSASMRAIARVEQISTLSPADITEPGSAGPGAIVRVDLFERSGSCLAGDTLASADHPLQIQGLTPA